MGRDFWFYYEDPEMVDCEQHELNMRIEWNKFLPHTHGSYYNEDNIKDRIHTWSIELCNADEDTAELADAISVFCALLKQMRKNYKDHIWIHYN